MVLLVIGASSDMGMSLIRSTHNHYNKIIAHYFHMSDELEALRKEVGNKMVLIKADLSSENEVTNLIAKTKEICDCPSHIVHFPAPKCNNSKFHKIQWDVFQNEYNISVRSAVLI